MAQAPNKSFEELGYISGTDKVLHHGYQRFYPRYLETLRDSATGMLEIGIDYHKSLHLWKGYFTKAHIYGIDINDKVLVDPRVSILKADQSKRADLEQILTKITHPVQFIIDDGSHIPEHQVLTFNVLFDKLLQPGGVYIVEDIETSYWTRDKIYGYDTRYGYRHPNSFIEKVKPVADAINSEFLLPAFKKHNVDLLADFNPATLSMIGTMTFGQNCVIFTKKTVAESEKYTRPYRISNVL